MAITVASLKAVLDLDNDKFKKGLKGASDGLKDTERKSRSLGNVLKGALGGASVIAAAGIGGLAAGLVALGSAAVAASLDYNKALSTIGSKTGATGNELNAMGDSVKEIFSNNWGSSMADVGDVVGTINSTLGATGEELTKLSEDALIFRDVLGVDVLESARAVRSAMEMFGVTGDEVFNRMAATIQSVGDPAGDLADTINEYSSVFAQAGFSADEMFGILEAGVKEGARNFDVVADAVKEFTIRIQDGSDSTREAMNALYENTGDVGSGYFQLRDRIAETTIAIEENATALSNSQGAYEAQSKVVSGLERELADAQRKLEELARPNLKGLSEYDDQLFELEMQAKEAKLQLLQLTPDDDRYQAAADKVSNFNNEIEKLNLQRDLDLEPKFRELEKAIGDGIDKSVSFEQALLMISLQKEKIAGLGDEFAKESNALEAAAMAVETYTDRGDDLTAQLEYQQNLFSQMKSPADELFAAMANGNTSARDAMSNVIQMLGQIDDQMLQNQIGVALFGTKWEDLGPQVILALDPANVAAQEFGGTLDQINDSIGESGLNGFADLWRDVQTALEPVGAILLQAANEALPVLKDIIEASVPVIQSFAAEFGEKLGPALQIIVNSLNRIGEALGLTNGEMSGAEMIAAALGVALDVLVTALEATAVGFHLLSGYVETISKIVKDFNGFVERGVRGWWDAADALRAMADAAADLVASNLGSGSLGGNLLNVATGGISGGIGKLFGFATGGTVPGQMGQPQLAIVHGGETVIPVGGNGGGINITIGSVSASSDSNSVDEAIRMTVDLLRSQLARAAG